MSLGFIWLLIVFSRTTKISHRQVYDKGNEENNPVLIYSRDGSVIIHIPNVHRSASESIQAKD